MKTVIVKKESSEVVNSNLKFRVLIGRKRLDQFRHETYSSAKDRLFVLKRIFRFSKLEILIIE